MSERKQRAAAEAGFGVNSRCLRLGVEERKKSGGSTLKGATAGAVLSNEFSLCREKP